ncbi:MAG: hypothetical protein M3O70_22610 [Actinomycetota bacterium]|nr:hypothetical protein [Actinomycetota bacterium]
MGIGARCLLAVIAVVVSACAAQASATAPPAPSGDAQPETTPTLIAPSDPDLVMNWAAAFSLALPNGWVVRDCDGERTTVCLYDGDVVLGDIELLAAYPLDPDQVRQTPQALLRDWAADFVTQFREDRAQGCSTFTFTEDEPTDAVVGGQPATRAAFTLTDDSGHVVERVITYYTLQANTVTIVTIDAYVDDGGCLGPSEHDPSFRPQHLAELEPYLNRLIAHTPLPLATASWKIYWADWLKALDEG